MREMYEELNLKPTDYYISTIGAPYIEEKSSKSYPTLRSIYEIHRVKIFLWRCADIQNGYNTIDKEDGKTRLFFKWSDKNHPA